MGVVGHAAHCTGQKQGCGQSRAGLAACAPRTCPRRENPGRGGPSPFCYSR
ncbi:hypothetical protein BOO71_0009961 [Deinococcus marmoris]|uniref:Uncharacterized protein n=1 Tax=Deinococcus marmoris TaxID=249408 RepID=A0A1U7NVW3_9DEIO|nr:hypothetical protein BOO71_0009961 [Deinococcus marmoris]